MTNVSITAAGPHASCTSTDHIPSTQSGAAGYITPLQIALYAQTAGLNLGGASLTLSGAFNSVPAITINDTTNPAITTLYTIWKHTPPPLNVGDTVPSFILKYEGNPSINHPNYTEGDYTWQLGINTDQSNPNIGGIGFSFESSYTPNGTYLQTEAHLVGYRKDGTPTRHLSFASPSTSVAGATGGSATGDYFDFYDMSGTQILKIWQHNNAVFLVNGASFYISDALGNGNISMSANGSVTLGTQQITQGSLVLDNTAAGAFATTIKSSNSASAAWTFTFPTTAGTSGYVLSTDGAGVTSWVNPATGVTTLTVNTTLTSGASVGQVFYSDGSKLQASGLLTSNQLAFGIGAGRAASTGTGNTAIGTNAGSSITVPASGANPQACTIVGNGAGQALTTGRECTLIGFNAGNLITGNGAGAEDCLHTFIGSYAGARCTGTGTTANTGIGQKSLTNVTTSGGNTAIGAHSGVNLTGSYNVAIGFSAMDGGGTTFAGDNNTVVGTQALPMAGTKNDNTALGYQSLFNQAAADANTAVGKWSGYANTTGTNNCHSFKPLAPLNSRNKCVPRCRRWAF